MLTSPSFEKELSKPFVGLSSGHHSVKGQLAEWTNLVKQCNYTMAALAVGRTESREMWLSTDTPLVVLSRPLGQCLRLSLGEEMRFYLPELPRSVSQINPPDDERPVHTDLEQCGVHRMNFELLTL